MKKKDKKFSGRFKFLSAVIVIYLLAFFFDYERALQGVQKTFLMLAKIIPLLLIVLIIMTIMNLYLDSGKMEKHFGKESGIRGWFYAIVTGVLISGPPYVFYPMLKKMKENGAKTSLLAVFLYNRNVKLAFLPAMVYYFGLKYTIIVSFLIVVFSILNGLLVEALTEK